MTSVLLVEGPDTEANARLRYQLLCAKHTLVVVQANRGIRLPLRGLPKLVLIHAVEPDRCNTVLRLLRAAGFAMPVVILVPCDANGERRYRLTVDCGALSTSDLIGMLETFAQLPLVANGDGPTVSETQAAGEKIGAAPQVIPDLAEKSAAPPPKRRRAGAKSQGLVGRHAGGSADSTERAPNPAA